MAYEAPLETHIQPADLLTYMYPVDSIYMSTANTSPQSFLGGTWTAIQDTFLLASGSTYTNATTGGVATRTLSTSNIPSHTHTVSSGTTGTISADHSHTYSATTDTQGSHTHPHSGDWDANSGGTNSIHSTGTSGAAGTVTTSGASDHTHGFSGTSSGQSAGHTHGVSLTSSTDGNASPTSFSIMPPYTVVYMWRRSA